MDAYSTSKRKFLARLRLTRKSLSANNMLITSLFRRFAPYVRYSVASLLTNRVYKDIMNIVFNVFDRQAQVPCALRLTRKSLYANITLITSLFRQSLTASPYESRLPCQNKTEFCSVLFFLQGNGRVFDQQAQVPCAVASDAKVSFYKYHAYYFAIPSLRSLRIASIRINMLITSLFRRFAPYESRL